MRKEDLRKIVQMQRKNLSQYELGTERKELNEIRTNISFAIVISGIRRSGKSTLLRQFAKKVKNFYYFNFEDPKVASFELNDFEVLNEVFIEEFGKKNYYFFDEIQNIEKWELFVRSLLDRRKHVLITGSNASLLSRELGTRLTGRHLDYELFPFSFGEFLKFIKKKANIKSFQEYFTKGGFPEYLKLGQARVLQDLVNDVLIRDISARHGIRNLKTLKQMAVYLMTNVGKEFSYNSLKNMFNLGSINSVISFISYFEDSYLLFTIPKFDYSYKKQLINPKKIYSIDNGLSIVNSASFSEDKGKMLENLIFQNLRRKYKDIFYFQEKGECDFVIKDRNKVKEVIQACYKLTRENEKREVDGLLEAMKEFKLNEGLIITFNQEDKLSIKGRTIRLIPAWKWLLGK